MSFSYSTEQYPKAYACFNCHEPIHKQEEHWPRARLYWHHIQTGSQFCQLYALSSAGEWIPQPITRARPAHTIRELP